METRDKYSARIGGIYFRNVSEPIVCNSVCLIKISRNSETGLLAASFDLTSQDRQPIAYIKDNQIDLRDQQNYQVLIGCNRSSIIELRNGRIWCDIKFGPKNSNYELDVSCILFSENGYPIILHPDRSKFGKINDNEPPNISSLTMTTDLNNTATAIGIKNGALYLLSVAIENFRTGISIIHTVGTE